MNRDAESDFLISLGTFQKLVTKIESGKGKYLLSIQTNKERDHLLVEMTDLVERVWSQELGFAYFEKSRKNMGMEGPYKIYFTILRESLLNSNLDIDQEEGGPFFIKLNYLITKGISMNGKLHIGKPCQRAKEEKNFKAFLDDFVFGIVDNLQTEKKMLADECNDIKHKYENHMAECKRKSYTSDSSVMQSFLAEEPLKKKKPKTDLHNPNSKKRKSVGARFGPTDSHNNEIYDLD